MITINKKNGESSIWKPSSKYKNIKSIDKEAKKEYFKEDKKKVDFGVISKYFMDKGFGFISHTFFNKEEKVFFHIKNIKINFPELAEKLETEDSFKGTSFWYEFLENEKGEQLISIINSNNLKDKYQDNLPIFIEKIKKLWKDIDSKIPDWLNDITIDLMGEIHANKLITKREKKENKILKKAKKVQKKENAKYKKEKKKEKKQRKIENKEFKKLVAEMIPLKFTQSSQVSSYIRKNKLGNKYKNISGIVSMEGDGRTWDFNGGFPCHIYAKLCSKLKLSNKGSFAKATGFKSYKSLK